MELSTVLSAASVRRLSKGAPQWPTVGSPAFIFVPRAVVSVMPCTGGRVRSGAILTTCI